MRNRALIVAVLFLLSSVTTPARAFLPPAIYAAYMTASVSGATYTMAALSGAIGLTGLYLTIQDAADNQVRIPLGDKPENAVPVPTAVPSVPSSESRKFYGPGGYLYSSAGEACSESYASQPGASCQCDEFFCTVFLDGNYATSLSPLYQQTVSCPPGYSQSGSSCNLENARQATDDKACDLLYSQGAFGTANDINCGATVDDTKLAPMIRDGKVIA